MLSENENAYGTGFAGLGFLREKLKRIMKKEYRPISCDFYDELEIAAMRQTNAVIVYKSEANEEVKITEKIKTIEARSGEEFLILSKGDEIRLDRLISIDGKKLKSYC